MIVPYLKQWRRSRMARRLTSVRESGGGVYLREWLPTDADPEEGTVSAAAILGWCRETMASTRRPWGIAHFDLALATSSAAAVRHSLSLRRLDPADLYPGDSLLAEVERFLREHGPASHVAVALFSWGDATFAAQQS